MRLIVVTTEGVETLRWVEGERSAQRLERGLDGESVSSLAAPKGSVWCGTAAGVLYRSDSRGAGGWRDVFREPEGRGITAVAGVAGEAEDLLVGTEPAAVHRSTDAGGSWRELEAFRRLGQVEDWRGYGTREPHVQTLAPDPHEPRRIYAGVELGGAYRTDDGGGSWSKATSGLYEDIHELLVEPRDSSRVYAATGGGFYTTDTRGRDWRDTTPDVSEDGFGGDYCTDLVPVGPGPRSKRSALVLATAGSAPGSWARRPEGAESRLHRSVDGGETWEEIEPWSRLAHRSGLTALARAPFDSGGFFVGTSEGAIHYSSAPDAGWVAVYRTGTGIRRMTAL